MTRQNKIRQDETRESKTSKAKTKGDTTSQGNARQTQKSRDNTEKNIDGDWFTLGRTSRPGSKQRKTNEVKRRQGKTRQDKPRDKTRYCPTTNNKKTSEELASKAGEDKTRVDMTRQIEKCRIIVAVLSRYCRGIVALLSRYCCVIVVFSVCGILSKVRVARRAMSKY